MSADLHPYCCIALSPCKTQKKRTISALIIEIHFSFTAVFKRIEKKPVSFLDRRYCFWLINYFFDDIQRSLSAFVKIAPHIFSEYSKHQYLES